VAITVKVDTWDDTKWDDATSPVSLILANDTFTVSLIDLNNRYVTFAPGSTSYTNNLYARNWEDSSWDDNYTGLSTIALSQTFTVSLLDYNNRVVWLTG